LNREDEPSFGKQEEKSIELGEQPLDSNNKNFLNENFNNDEIPQIRIDRTHSNSPPLVTSKHSNLEALLGSPPGSKKKKDPNFTGGDHLEGKILSSPKEKSASGKK
jgi:hypothetical protein